MPIVWIEDSSPLSIAVESDDGKILNRMEVEDVDGKNAVWRLTDIHNPHASNPMYKTAFRMRRRDGEKGKSGFVLGIEFQPESKPC